MLAPKSFRSTVLLALASVLVGCGGGNDTPAAVAGSAGSAGQPTTTGGATATGGSSAGSGGSVVTAGSAGAAVTTGGGGAAATGGTAAGTAGTAPAGGSAGTAGAGGAMGGGGGSSGGAGGSGGAATFPDPSTFVCNGMLGVSVNDDWFTAGFETVVPDAKWQLRWRSLAFVELWADPQNSIWSEPLVSACASGSTSPDRVLYTPVNWTYTTTDEWLPKLTAVIENIKTKYQGVKEIDLMTMLRAPGNMVCGDPSVAATKEQVTAPVLDQSITLVAAKYPGLVRVLPPFYAPSCDVFLPNSPHYAAGKAAVVSKVFSDYFATH
ncbi:MAG TPA: hypothetical protein VNG33_19610 [Polyangiaceae bacterium]|nr:hypothetical protein [Polyangiaceae bacterium]